MKVRCPECYREVNAPRDALSEHKRKGRFSWESARCTGSGLPALPLAIAQLEERIANSRDWIERRRGEIARLEASIAEAVAKDVEREATLAKLRKRAAKGGAK